MRSELVIAAMGYISNRFLLTRLAAKATRKLHKPNTRIQNTMNDVFERFCQPDTIAGLARNPQFATVPVRRSS